MAYRSIRQGPLTLVIALIVALLIGTVVFWMVQDWTKNPLTLPPPTNRADKS